MDEFALIDRYFRRAGGAGVRLGVGDDAALLEVPAGRLLVAAVDTLVEGVHYPPSLAAADIGYRALAVNLSDLAAMGAEPCWATLALTLPAADADWLQGFADGLFEAAAAHDVALVGGDTTHGSQTVISLQLLGHVDPDRALTRAGCREGDLLYVSGTVGDAAAGLELIVAGEGQGDLQQRFRRPAPRVALGGAVAGLASAAIDLSDGLYADLSRLLAASGAGARVDWQALPVSAALRERAGDDAARRLALGGGDDYELCLAVPRDRAAEFEAAAAAAGATVTRIGEAVAGTGIALLNGGEPVDYRHAGYRHFDDGETA